MPAQYIKGKVDVIETKTGPKDARYKTTSNVQKFKTRLTEFPWRWIMLICFIAIVVAILVVPIVVTVHSNGDREGIRFLYFNPHLPSGPIHPYQLDESISNFRGAWCTFSVLFYFEYIFLLANIEDPD